MMNAKNATTPQMLTVKSIGGNEIRTIRRHNMFEDELPSTGHILNQINTRSSDCNGCIFDLQFEEEEEEEKSSIEKYNISRNFEVLQYAVVSFYFR